MSGVYRVYVTRILHQVCIKLKSIDRRFVDCFRTKHHANWWFLAFRTCYLDVKSASSMYRVYMLESTANSFDFSFFSCPKNV